MMSLNILPCVTKLGDICGVFCPPLIFYGALSTEEISIEGVPLALRSARVESFRKLVKRLENASRKKKEKQNIFISIFTKVSQDGS